MPYIVKWVQPTGDVGQSAPHLSPSEALRFSHALVPSPQRIWVEDDAGNRYQLTLVASAADDSVGWRPHDELPA